MIPVTKPFFPDQEVYSKYIDQIWQQGWLTNGGVLKEKLEQALMEFLEVDSIIITNNGTISLQIAIQRLCNSGEVITTPFSYIATSSSIVWQNCKPVFVDISEDFLTIDEEKIEEAITSRTQAILATHVFGNPCNIAVIENIAKKYGLYVIYDAAHCFGVKYKGQSIFKYGDVSICSFHATKLFHCAEGGAIFSNNPSLTDELSYSVNFGHKTQYEYHGLGINAKISELHAAMGLSVLPSIGSILDENQKKVQLYLRRLNLTRLKTFKLRDGVEWNHCYFPIVFDSENLLIATIEALHTEQVFPRRYFYPSLNTIPYLSGQKMPIAESIASRVLCLPLFNSLDHKSIETICQIINSVQEEFKGQ